MVVRALSGNGGGGGERQLVKKSGKNTSAYTITDLQVGKQYILVCITDSSVENNAKIQTTIASVTNGTYEELQTPSSINISSYVGYSAYKIVPSATSITINMQSYSSFYMLFE